MSYVVRRLPPGALRGSIGGAVPSRLWRALPAGMGWDGMRRRRSRRCIRRLQLDVVALCRVVRAELRIGAPNTSNTVSLMVNVVCTPSQLLRFGHSLIDSSLLVADDYSALSPLPLSMH